MKIVKPSYEILDQIDGQAILKKLELIGRVSHKSEDRITETSAAPFVKKIIELGDESVLEHVSITVRFICDRGVSHELVRHRIAAFCVSGDTVIRSMAQKSWTVKELFDWQFDVKRKGRLQLIKARSVDEATNIIVPNHIKKITYMGIKPILKVITESGRALKCTADHRIYTPNGYTELKDLSAGDYIYSNGKELLENEDWLRNYYLTENHTRKETADFIGCCESYVYKAFKKFGIKKPWSDRPNRHPGHGNKGMFTKEQRENISKKMTGKNNPAYIQDRNFVTKQAGYQESVRHLERNQCEWCGSTSNIEIHHKNKNPTDNSAENVMQLCPHCHHLWHHDGAIGVFKDKIVSIQELGAEPVYDITMEEPYHNYVANSIVVHNCQESTRYCNYSKDGFGNEITVIQPCFLSDMTYLDMEEEIPCASRGFTHKDFAWYNAMQHAETFYFDMLKAGATPEEARSVLPNSLKTEVVCTANLREIRHILKLRCNKRAHPQIRELMVPLLHELQAKIPVVFDDIAERIREQNE